MSENLESKTYRVVQSRYGFKKIQVDGVALLEPLSKEELVSRLLAAEKFAHASKVMNAKPEDSWCAQRSDGSCYSNNGCQNCASVVVDDETSVCDCNDA